MVTDYLTSGQTKFYSQNVTNLGIHPRDQMRRLMADELTGFRRKNGITP